MKLWKMKTSFFKCLKAINFVARKWTSTIREQEKDRLTPVSSIHSEPCVVYCKELLYLWCLTYLNAL